MAILQYLEYVTCLRLSVMDIRAITSNLQFLRDVLQMLSFILKLLHGTFLLCCHPT